MVYRPGFLMAKASVHQLDLQDGSVEQGELDLDAGIEDRGGLMLAVDQLNQRVRAVPVAIASAGTAGGTQLGHAAGAKGCLTTRRAGRACRGRSLRQRKYFADSEFVLPFSASCSTLAAG